MSDREWLKRAALAVCRTCREGKPLKQYAGGDYYHLWGEHDYLCTASPVWRLFDEAHS